MTRLTYEELLELTLAELQVLLPIEEAELPPLEIEAIDYDVFFDWIKQKLYVAHITEARDSKLT